ARPCDASASLNASSVGSPRFYTPLRPRQIRLANFVPVELHSASGGGGHGNTTRPYESPDGGESGWASAQTPPSLCPPPGAHRGAPYSTSPRVRGTSACPHHRPLPARRRDAQQHDKNRVPPHQTAASRPDNSSCPAPHRPL